MIVDVAPEINGAGAARIRDFAATPELDSPEAFLERAVKFNPLRHPAVLRRSLYYNLRETPAGQWTFTDAGGDQSAPVSALGGVSLVAEPRHQL